MRWALWIVGSLAGIAALVFIIGALLPRGHVATRSARYRQPPDALWRAITNFEDFPKWRPGIQSVERLPDLDGHLVWMERSGTGHSAQKMPYEVIESFPPNGVTAGRLVTKIADPKLPFGGTWTYDIVSIADGETELRITERGEVYNPVFRFVSRVFMSQTKTMNDYLIALGNKFGEALTPGE
jgi:uncharacterized protein YndB with AHSA1/START domain